MNPESKRNNLSEPNAAKLQHMLTDLTIPLDGPVARLFEARMPDALKNTRQDIHGAFAQVSAQIATCQDMGMRIRQTIAPPQRRTDNPTAIRQLCCEKGYPYQTFTYYDFSLPLGENFNAEVIEGYFFESDKNAFTPITIHNILYSRGNGSTSGYPFFAIATPFTTLPIFVNKITRYERVGALGLRQRDTAGVSRKNDWLIIKQPS